MKKLITLSVLICCTVFTLAQLHIAVSHPNVENILYDAGNVKLTQKGDTFYLASKDYRSAYYVNLNLGGSWEQAQESMIQLYDWFKNNKSGDYLIVTQSDGLLTIYKASPTLCLFSHANVTTCKATYKNAIEAVLLDATFALGLLENTEPIGLCSQTRLKQVYKYFR